MFFLRQLRDKGDESFFALRSGVTRLGRDPDSDVVLDDYGVSRRHAEVTVARGAVVVRDLGSRNGTRVRPGGAPESAGVILRGKGRKTDVAEHEIAVGDEVQLGSVRLVLTESLGEGREPAGAAAAAAPPAASTVAGAASRATSRAAAAAPTPAASPAPAETAEPETLDLSGNRAVLLLDFVARFAQGLTGPATRLAAGDAVERLRAFAAASRLDVVRAGPEGCTPLLTARAAVARTGAALPPEADEAARRAVAAGGTRSQWTDARSGREATLALPLGEDIVLVVQFQERRGRPGLEEVRSLEVGGAIAGQFLRLVLAVEALESANRELAVEADVLRRAPAGGAGEREVVARSPAMRRVLEEAKEGAKSSQPVLLTGETGAGKEVVARFIHEKSPRRDRHFVAVNCASLGGELFESELFGHKKGAFTSAVADKAGLFELADGGTLFLDEVGELAAGAQARLLRVLEDGRFRRVGEERERAADVRVIAATNRELAVEVKEGRFRKDLRFRLDVFHLVVPPLRERPEDILPLAEAFVRAFAAESGKKGLELDVEASRLLHAWSWPGNVRELRNVIGRAVALARGPVLGARELRFSPDAEAAADPLAGLLALKRDEAQEAFKKLYLERLLLACGGNVSRAARAAGMDRRNLQIAMAKLGLRRGGDEDAEEE